MGGEQFFDFVLRKKHYIFHEKMSQQHNLCPTTKEKEAER